MKPQNPDILLKEYQLKSEEIIEKMLFVLLRAQRKVHDDAYDKYLQKLAQ